MARNVTLPSSLPSEPETAVGYWRSRAEKAEEEVAQLRQALKRMEAIAAGKPVPSIVRARKPKPRL